MKNFTYGDGMAIMILAARKVGLNPGFVADATRHLATGDLHPMAFAAMEGEAVRCGERVRQSIANVCLANIHADILKAEYGFHTEISEEAYRVLQAEAESLDTDHAKGQDLAEHAQRRDVIDRIMSDSPWTLHPDHGCILKSEVEHRDREVMR